MRKLTIIGSGPGGYTAAFAAARAGHSVTLVESAAVGGTCLHTGCIPTKTFKSSADTLEKIRHADGLAIIGCTKAAIDMPALLARKNLSLIHIYRRTWRQAAVPRERTPPVPWKFLR